MGDVPEVPTTTVKDSGPLVMDKKLSYLDVRTPEEYANEHVVGSVNVPWFLDLKTRQVRSNMRQHAPEPRACFNRLQHQSTGTLWGPAGLESRHDKRYTS